MGYGTMLLQFCKAIHYVAEYGSCFIFLKTNFGPNKRAQISLFTIVSYYIGIVQGLVTIMKSQGIIPIQFLQGINFILQNHSLNFLLKPPTLNNLDGYNISSNFINSLVHDTTESTTNYVTNIVLVFVDGLTKWLNVLFLLKCYHCLKCYKNTNLFYFNRLIQIDFIL